MNPISQTNTTSKTRNNALPRVAAIQMKTGCDLDKNLADAETLVEQAVQAGANLVVLPEYFSIMGNSESDRLKVVDLNSNGKVHVFLKGLAKRLNTWIVGGSHAVESNDQKRPYGRCLIYSASGELVTSYDKIHLFDVSVADNTKSYRESAGCTPGKDVCVFDTPWGKAGVAICYDLRFPELFREMVAQGAQMIFLPAAFTAKTGAAHWEVLLRARAIENQAYVIASAQAGVHENGRETWGHSCIISPHGEVIKMLKQEVGIALADLDFAQLEAYRQTFPALKHRRDVDSK
ncbi:carbon-nitrogen hydrolase family protein [Aliikangiella sp. IMCC44632]